MLHPNAASHTLLRCVAYSSAEGAQLPPLDWAFDLLQKKSEHCKHWAMAEDRAAGEDINDNMGNQIQPVPGNVFYNPRRLLPVESLSLTVC